MFNRGTILSGRTREVHMDSIERELMQRRQTLEKAIEMAQKAIETAPEGWLRVDASKKQIQYYRVLNEHHRGVYITRKDAEIAALLANKQYAENVMSKASKEMHSLDRYMTCLERDNANDVYSKLNDARKILVTPILLDDETMRKTWIAQPYEQSDKYSEQLKFQTRDGKMVRSKSEAFIANLYLEFGIPYRYEAALLLKNNVTCYPDFTILDIAHRRIVHHEHLGRLDQPEYLEEQMWKLGEYRKNGIFVGKNLILTGETKSHPFNPEQFRASVREMFLV